MLCMKKSKKSKKRPTPARAPEKFSYCVGRPWPINENNPDGTHIAVFGYHTEVHHGTMKDAEQFRSYVDEQTKEKNFIYKLVLVAPVKKKK